MPTNIFNKNIAGEDDLDILVHQVNSEIQPGHIVFLSGILGAGKTTFVRKYIEIMYEDKIIVTSPSYTLVNIYDTDPKIVHIDLYRLNKLHTNDIMQFEELIFDNKCIKFIEWGNELIDYFKLIRYYILKFEIIQKLGNRNVTLLKY